jgi:hypothetical protein
MNISGFGEPHLAKFPLALCGGAVAFPMRRLASPSVTTTLSLRCACHNVASRREPSRPNAHELVFQTSGDAGLTEISTGDCGELDCDDVIAELRQT